METMQCFKLLLFLSMLGPAVGYKILVICTAPTRSHSALAKGIVTSLLDAGHEVTWATPYTDWTPHKNLKLIEVDEVLELSRDLDMTKRSKEGFSFVKAFTKNITVLTASNRQLRDTLVKENFDAVVTEWFFSDTDAGYAAVQQAPWIMFIGGAMMPDIEVMVQDVQSVSVAPLIMLDFPIPMNLFQRLINFGFYLLTLFGRVSEASTLEERYDSFFTDLAKARGVNLPSFQEARYNVSILFTNSHPSIAPALSLPPNVVDIGGFHIDEAKPLPQDLQTLMDSSKCIVFFSMGSILKGTMLPESLRAQLIEIFEGQHCTVLWKFEEQLNTKSDKIIVRKWWPQASILAHPKVKVFITHGGMLSTLEAVKNGVPLLAVPVFADQPANAARAARDGYAVTVPYGVDMAPKIKEALHELLSNDRYHSTAQFLSKGFNKRPAPPRKTIVSYIELAIETKGALHLRSESFLYQWYERYMLDVLALLLVIFYGIYAVCRRICCSQSQKKNERKVKKN